MKLHTQTAFLDSLVQLFIIGENIIGNDNACLVYGDISSMGHKIQAAVLDVKLKHLDECNAHRQKIAAYYYDHINNPHVTLPVCLDNANNVYHIFPILCDKRDELQKHMTDSGIQTIIHYPIPPHKQECYLEMNRDSFPIAEHIADCELSIPISPVHRMEEIDEVVKAINFF